MKVSESMDSKGCSGYQPLGNVLHSQKLRKPIPESFSSFRAILKTPFQPLGKIFQNVQWEVVILVWNERSCYQDSQCLIFVIPLERNLLAHNLVNQAAFISSEKVMKRFLHEPDNQNNTWNKIGVQLGSNQSISCAMHVYTISSFRKF